MYAQNVVVFNLTVLRQRQIKSREKTPCIQYMYMIYCTCVYNRYICKALQQTLTSSVGPSRGNATESLPAQEELFVCDVGSGKDD